MHIIWASGVQVDLTKPFIDYYILYISKKWTLGKKEDVSTKEAAVELRVSPNTTSLIRMVNKQSLLKSLLR